MSSVTSDLKMEIPTADSTLDGFSDFLSPTVPTRDNDTLPSSLLPPHTPNHSMAETSVTSAMSPDGATLRAENRMLKARLRQTQADLQAEQDCVANLRRKLNTQERGRLDAISKANEEASRLDTEVTRLRAQVEKGEAIRQSLEFELAKAHKDQSTDRRSANEQHHALIEANEALKGQVGDLTKRVNQLGQELARSKDTLTAQEAASRLSLEEKERKIADVAAERDVIDQEREKVHEAFRLQERLNKDLQEKIQQLESEARLNNDAMHRQVADAEVQREREERLKKDFEVALDRIRNLEENVEGERAAHLETKFNSEIVQLRIRDLEGALNFEKTGKSEALSSTDKLNKQLQELQQILDEEKKTSKIDRERFEKAEKEYTLLSKQLKAELDEKKSIIRKLSTQLEEHTTNFNELKDELSKAKKRQAYLEETYGGNMRELEILVNNFPAPVDVTGKKKQAGKKSLKSSSPSAVLGSLRQTLMDYRKQLDNAGLELSRSKGEIEKLRLESSSQKEEWVKKQKTLQSAQKSASHAHKELNQLKTTHTDLEMSLNQSKAELQEAVKRLEKERKDHNKLQEQMVKVATKYRADEKARVDFLQVLHQQLTQGRLHSPDKPSSDLAWPELSVLVNEQVALTLNSIQRTQEKVQHLECVLATKEELMTQIQQSHDTQINKLASTSDKTSADWHQQKQELERHYSHLLEEIHTRHKKTQTLADQAWEKIRVSGTVQQGLESEIVQLRHQMETLTMEHQALLATCAALTGVLYPLCARTVSLIMQRTVLSTQLDKFSAFKKQAGLLVDALESNAKDSVNPGKKTLTPLLLFRKGVLTVLAANRLAHFQRGNSSLFSLPEPVPGIENALVCTGGLIKKDKVFTGVSHPWLLGNSNKREGEEGVLAWFNSAELLNSVMATMGDVQVCLDNLAGKGSECDRPILLSTARSCMAKLFCHLPGLFPAVQVDACRGLTEKQSLLRLLGMGLDRALSMAGRDGRRPYAASEVVLGRLQNQVLEFTQRLHSTEVERRDLRSEVGRLNQERRQWSNATTAAKSLQQDLDKVTKQLETSVPRDRFDSVCSELESALRREQQVQVVLKEQSGHLERLTSQLDTQNSQDYIKDNTMAEVVQGMSDAKNELKRQEHLVRQLNRQIQTADMDKRNIEHKVKDAENALRTAAKDKEILQTYILNVEKALEKLFSAQTKTTSALSGVYNAIDLSPLVQSELMPVNPGRKGPELAATQRLVNGFVDGLQQLNVRLKTLHEELGANHSHIANLKKELGEACKREYDQQVDFQFGDLLPVFPTNDNKPVLGLSSSPPTKLHESFAPLLIDESDSYYAPSPAVSKQKQHKSSKSARNASYNFPKARKQLSSGIPKSSSSTRKSLH